MSAALRPVRLRAAWALPIASPPIENAEIVIEEGRIAEIRVAGSGSDSGARDFGDAILLPGLVNIHTHLEYTVMRGLLEDIEFFPWIRALTARKAALDAEDWRASAICGAAEAVAAGVTTVADCTDSGAALDGALELGLGGLIYQEVFGIDEALPVETIVSELAEKVRRLAARAAGTRLRVGISPHSPYTVRPALMRALAEYARRDGLPVCIHAAESQAEAELLRSGTGPIAAMFARRGIDWRAPGVSAVAYLDSFGLLSRKTLLVHGVQLAAGDRKIACDREVGWAHCPKSNAKLGVGVSPLGLLARDESAGLPIGIGTDSVASNNGIDLFEEMRFAVLIQRASRRSIVASGAQDVLRMATIGGARALGLEKEIGSLAPGMRADLCVVRIGELHSAPAYDPCSALVYAAHAADVVCTLIDGEIRYDAERGAGPGERFPHAALEPARARLRSAQAKMRSWTGA